MFRLFKAAHHANKNILSALVPRRGAGLHAVCLDAGGRYRTRLGVTCADFSVCPVTVRLSQQELGSCLDLPLSLSAIRACLIIAIERLKNFGCECLGTRVWNMKMCKSYTA